MAGRNQNQDRKTEANCLPVSMLWQSMKASAPGERLYLEKEIM